MSPTPRSARVHWSRKLAALGVAGVLAAASAVALTVTPASAAEPELEFQGLDSASIKCVDDSPVATVVEDAYWTGGTHEVTATYNGEPFGTPVTVSSADDSGFVQIPFSGPVEPGENVTIKIAIEGEFSNAEFNLDALEHCGLEQPEQQPEVPTPVIHVANACLSNDGKTVEPYDLSFTWDGVKGKTFGVTYKFNEVNADGSLGQAVNGGFADFQTDGFALWPNTEGIHADAVTYGLHAGEFAVSIFLTDFSHITSVTGSGWGGYEGEVHGPTATKKFTVSTCAPAMITTNVESVATAAPVTISVTGAHPGEKLNFELHSAVVQLGTATADSEGNASLTASIPASVPAGAHTVVVTGEWTHLEQKLTVTGASRLTTTDKASRAVQSDPSISTHKTPTVVQTDGTSSPTLWLTIAVLLMGLVSAGGAGLLWHRSRVTH